jgi:hypothetical protein
VIKRACGNVRSHRKLLEMPAKEDTGSGMALMRTTMLYLCVVMGGFPQFIPQRFV